MKRLKKLRLKEGVKNDQEKEKLSLLSTIWLMGVGRVLTFGATKYAAHNWRLGMKRTRLMDAAMRHLLAYNNGEDRDFDPNCKGCQRKKCKAHSGENHLDAASCCIMFMRELHDTMPETDDRYKVRKKK